jgi:hypothetical protein
MQVTKAVRVALIVAMSLLNVAHAEDQYIKDNKGCKIANPNPKPNESVTWSGTCVNGFAQGAGVMEWRVNEQPGGRYEGNLDKGVVSGKGKLTMPDGTSYEGEWKAGRPDGEGVYTDQSGETLKGLWKEGEYVGAGGSR